MAGSGSIWTPSRGCEMGSSALDALLVGLVDYAGLFPPAALPMRAAVEQYARYWQSEHRWILGRFVLPAGRLAEFEASLGYQPRADDPWRLSAIAAAVDFNAITAFNEAHADRVLIDAIEAKASSPTEVAALERFADAFEVYVEIPVADGIELLVSAIKERGFSAKLRTGGVSPDAFPTPAQLAGALAECVRQGVSLKATAGLHHPLRGDYKLTYDADSPTGTMFGFLNVFLATMFLQLGMSETAAAALLVERDPAAIVLDSDSIRWRGHRLTTADIQRLREQGAHSFGSCSFTEPVSDLTSLGLL